MSVRDWLLQTVPDPIGTTGPAVVAAHPDEVDPGARFGAQPEAFATPPHDVVQEARHGGPGGMHNVPVTISGAVATTPKGAWRWGTDVVPIPDSTPGVGQLSVVQVLGLDPFRRSVSVQNVGAQTIYLAPKREQAIAGRCWPLAVGAVLNLDVRSPIWATSTAGGGGSLLAFAFSSDAADE